MYDSSDRGLASMTRAAAMAVALCFSALVPAMAADQPPTPAPAMTPSPGATPKGEFDDSCAMGLASGQVVKTDCSVNWAREFHARSILGAQGPVALTGIIAPICIPSSSGGFRPKRGHLGMTSSIAA